MTDLCIFKNGVYEVSLKQTKAGNSNNVKPNKTKPSLELKQEGQCEKLQVKESEVEKLCKERQKQRNKVNKGG